MSELKHVDFSQQSSKIKDKVCDYWTKRSESFFDLRHEEIESYMTSKWKSEINKLIEARKSLKVLDVGCGAGFFEIILGKEGHDVTGIDLTNEMVSKASKMLELYEMDSKNIRVMQMDGENLNFPDETFDMVISRNLTWTLPHPIEAYREWNRVLKKGGILLNFDAEYAKYAHKNLYSEENLAHKEISTELKDDCHAIYHMLTISSLPRPQWDVEVLKGIGFCEVNYDLSFGDRIFKEHDKFYIPDKMFSIKAIKG